MVSAIRYGCSWGKCLVASSVSGGCSDICAILQDINGTVGGGCMSNCPISSVVVIVGAVGGMVSTMMALLSARDCSGGMVKVALLLAAFCKVALPAKVMLLEFKSALFCPATGV